MEIQSMEKHRDDTSLMGYEGHSIVECDLKMQSSAQEADKLFDSSKLLMQTEQLLKDKEREVEMWQTKYNKINDELTTIKAKLNDTRNSTEVSLYEFVILAFFRNNAEKSQEMS